MIYLFYEKGVGMNDLRNTLILLMFSQTILLLSPIYQMYSTAHTGFVQISHK